MDIIWDNDLGNGVIFMVRNPHNEKYMLVNAPIILLTSLSDIKAKREAYSLGVDDYIIKGIK